MHASTMPRVSGSYRVRISLGIASYNAPGSGGGEIASTRTCPSNPRTHAWSGTRRGPVGFTVSMTKGSPPGMRTTIAT